MRLGPLDWAPRFPANALQEMLTVRTTVMMALVVGDGVVANFQKDTAATTSPYQAVVG